MELTLNAAGKAKLKAATTGKLRITLARRVELERSNPDPHHRAMIKAIKEELAARETPSLAAASHYLGARLLR